VSPPSAAAKRPDALRHINALFGEPRRNVTDWDLRARLRRPDAGRAFGRRREDLPVTLLPAVDALPAQNFYMAFREAGRVTRTIQLPRYLSDPQLRRRTTAATNKVESYNG
jgi:hypothetical protein